MAKVTGPLFSISASGKIADAMVHFPWKGLNVVRAWVKPVNRESFDQGDVRCILGGLGRCGKSVVNGSQYHIDAAAILTDTNTWLSKLVRDARSRYMNDGTECMAQLTIFNNLANVALWNSNALALGLSSMDLAYKGMANSFSYGLQLYMLVKYAIDENALDPTKFVNAIYAKALATWIQDDFDDLVIDIQTVV
jgi:hypothetical protein